MFILITDFKKICYVLWFSSFLVVVFGRGIFMCA